jgi:hypothetical protein
MESVTVDVAMLERHELGRAKEAPCPDDDRRPVVGAELGRQFVHIGGL